MVGIQSATAEIRRGKTKKKERRRRKKKTTGRKNNGLPYYITKQLNKTTSNWTRFVTLCVSWHANYSTLYAVLLTYTIRTLYKYIDKYQLSLTNPHEALHER